MERFSFHKISMTTRCHGNDPAHSTFFFGAIRVIWDQKDDDYCVEEGIKTCISIWDCQINWFTSNKTSVKIIAGLVLPKSPGSESKANGRFLC